MPQIILASQSPRRRQLLGQIGLTDFDILVPDADESYDAALLPQEIVCSISRKKAQAARALCGNSEAVILAADTMVFLDGLRLGKPHSEAEAYQMLSALSGREHLVCTGVTVCRGERLETRPETTSVRFADLSEEDIRRYIATGEPMDKAGAYGIQGRGCVLVEGIDGNYHNVVGLPTCLLAGMLRQVGIDVLTGGQEGRP